MSLEVLVFLQTLGTSASLCHAKDEKDGRFCGKEGAE